MQDDVEPIAGPALEPVESALARGIRAALAVRAHRVEDPRFCRIVNGNGDGLPGLFIDRFDTHYLLRTLDTALDERLDDVGRDLVEIAGARSVIARNDGPERARAGLLRLRPHVVRGTPPRWARALELGARFIFDLQQGWRSSFFHEDRELHRWLQRLSRDARVLDVATGVGAMFVHAGLGGARELLGFEADPDALDLARENAEANGLASHARLEAADPFTALKAVVRTPEPFDLILLGAVDCPAESAEAFLDLAIRATRHGGLLAFSSEASALEPALLSACKARRRMAHRIVRPSLPPDFPTPLAQPESRRPLICELM